MSNADIARTILAQLGGNVFCSMVGVHKDSSGLVAIDHGLRIMFSARAKYGINMMTVILTPMDLYTVTFFMARKDYAKTIEEYEDIYAEDLQRLFERVTGLATSLGNFGRVSFG